MNKQECQLEIVTHDCDCAHKCAHDVLSEAEFAACPKPCANRLVCRCHKVMEDDILEALASGTIGTLQDLMATTKAGDGCTCCHQELRTMIAQHAYTRQPQTV